MNIKPILVSLTAIFAVFLVLQAVSAYELVDQIPTVNIDGAEFIPPDYSNNIAVFAGETIPVKITFTALDDAEDVRLKVWIAGYRSEVSESTGRFDIFKDNVYTKRLSLKLPYDIDERDEATLVLRIETKKESDEFDYNLELQRESYELDLLSVEADKRVVAGDSIKVTIVLKNRGLHETEDTFAIVRISALDVEKKVYFGDLVPEDENDDCCKEDSTERKVSLRVPSDAQEGTYKLEVEAYNSDATTTVSREVTIVQSGEVSRVLAGVTSKTVAANEEAVFDIILVNPSNNMKIYSILPEENPSVMVSVDEPTVTIPADSSRTVKIRAKGFEKGTYSFALNVNSDDQTVERIALNLSVTKKSVESSVVILTIILAIIFIVLLIVLIALLTRKPTRSEEEESYY